MKRKALKLLPIAAISAWLLAMPISFDATANAAARGNLIRVNEACGQAAECVWAFNYICSTVNDDHTDYKCSQGCGGF